jgi:DNA-binding MarR family transcriptional regulator
MPFIYRSFGFLAAKASEELLELLQPHLDEEKITVRQMGILILLEDRPGVTQKQIGAVQRIDRTTVTQQIDLLEQANLVKRVQSADDRRSYNLHLTKKGRSMASRLKAYIQSTEAVFLKNLTEQQITDIKTALFALIDHEEMKK